MDEPTGESSVLAYGRVPRRTRRRVKLLMLVVFVAVLALLLAKPARKQVTQYLADRTLRYDATPAGLLMSSASYSRARGMESTIERVHPKEVALLDSRFGAVGGGRLIFAHELAAGPTKRLVILKLSVVALDTRSRMVEIYITPSIEGAPQPQFAWPIGIGALEEGMNVQIFSGQTDPADPATCVVPMNVNGQRYSLVGVLQPDGSLVIEPGKVTLPTTQLSPQSAPSVQ